MPDFFVASHRAGACEILIGYWPISKSRQQTYCLSIKELEIDWWCASDPSAQVLYGPVDVSRNWEAIDFVLGSAMYEKPLYRYSAVNEFADSQYIFSFELLFYPPILINDLLLSPGGERYKSTGILRGPWSFKDPGSWTIGVDSKTWLYFSFQGMEPTVDVNVKIVGREQPKPGNLDLKSGLPKYLSIQK